MSLKKVGKKLDLLAVQRNYSHLIFVDATLEKGEGELLNE